MSGGGASALPAFPFARAVTLAEFFGHGERWVSQFPEQLCKAMTLDHMRDSARMATMAGHRAAGNLRLPQYVEYVLPVSTGHSA